MIKTIREVKELKGNDIIKVNGVLGVVIRDKDRRLFWDKQTSTYWVNQLPEITVYEETTHEEKIDFLKQHFPWGEVVKVHHIFDYTVFEYISKMDKETQYHSFINYKDISIGAKSGQVALLNAMCYEKDGPNSQLPYYLNQILKFESNN